MNCVLGRFVTATSDALHRFHRRLPAGEGLRGECPPAAGIHKPSPDLTVKNGISYSAWTATNGIFCLLPHTNGMNGKIVRRQKMDSRTLIFFTSEMNSLGTLNILGTLLYATVSYSINVCMWGIFTLAYPVRRPKITGKLIYWTYRDWEHCDAPHFFSVRV